MAGSVGRVCPSRSCSHKSEPHTGYRDYVHTYINVTYHYMTAILAYTMLYMTAILILPMKYSCWKYITKSDQVSRFNHQFIGNRDN